MAFLNPVDVTTIVGVVTEEKLGSTLRAVRSRRYVWHVLLGLHSGFVPQALPCGRIRNDAQNSRNWPT